MGKKKKEIARLSEELKKVKIEPTGYATPHKPISPLVSTSLAGPSMHGAGYNYKNISSYGPSLTGESEPLESSETGKKERIKNWWQGLRPGTQDLAVESLFRLGEGAVKGVASLIATKKAARSNKSNSFAQQGRSGGGGGSYNSTSQPSYDELLNKY
jgi:hypothetical protein